MSFTKRRRVFLMRHGSVTYFDAAGNPLYRNRNTESASEKAKRKANREIKEMAERLSADQSIIV